MTERALTFMAKLKALFGQRRADRAFDEEMSTHLEMLAEKYEREGMSAKEAARAARRQFGNTTLLKQRQRESRTTMFFQNVWRDVRYGVRQLGKTPVFTIVCVLTLALGVGANTAVFSVMHAVLMRMIPAAEPGRLVVLHGKNKPGGAFDTGNGDTSISYGMFQALRGRTDTFQDVMMYVPLASSGKTAVRIGEVPEEASGDMVSGNFFSGLGVGMEAGRGFSARDEADHGAVVVISSKYWASRFGRDPGGGGQDDVCEGDPVHNCGRGGGGLRGNRGVELAGLLDPAPGQAGAECVGLGGEQGLQELPAQSSMVVRSGHGAAGSGCDAGEGARADSVDVPAGSV